eukprot:365209-Chlamydomonas_euryale.AAC.13
MFMLAFYAHGPLGPSLEATMVHKPYAHGPFGPSGGHVSRLGLRTRSKKLHILPGMEILTANEALNSAVCHILS